MRLIEYVRTKKDRCGLERVISLIQFHDIENFNRKNNRVIYGDIYNHLHTQIPQIRPFYFYFEDYKERKELLENVGIVKIWAGR
jgi:hypothetical protein